jgi:hypothetical protein
MGNRATNENRANKNGSPKMSEINKRFDGLLRAMATQPEPSGKSARDNRTSDKASGAGYGDTRTRDANAGF